MFNATGADLLLVEGEAVLADLTSFRLELLGFSLRVVSSSLEAQQQIESRKPDLLIIDSVLPDGDGIDYVSRLRTEFTPEELPVLVFSINPTLDSVERAFAGGAQAYLVTPFDPTTLEEKIQVLLKSSTTFAKQVSR